MSIRKSRWLQAALAGTLVVAALGGIPVAAKDSHDHDDARRALQAGEVLPLRTILDRIAGEHPGQVMEVELERERDRWIYEIKLLREGGALVKLEVDARDGRVLRVKDRERRAIDDGSGRPGKR